VELPTRAEAIATLQEGDAELRGLLNGVGEWALERAATIGGGDWSAKDLVGHLQSWEGFAVRTLEEWQRREEPWILQAAFSGAGGEQVDALNAFTYERTKAMRPGEVLQEYERTHAEMIALMEGMSDERWNEGPFWPAPEERRDGLGSLLGSVLGAPHRPFGHAFAHLPNLEDYVASLR
jgi:hypothetical protein